jgi:hypothetical protein
VASPWLSVVTELSDKSPGLVALRVTGRLATGPPYWSSAFTDIVEEDSPAVCMKTVEG